jgi:U32 family peptidase
MSKNKPELLAPAGSLKKLKYAFKYGADACYGSGPAFSMRTGQIKFPYQDLKLAIEYAHKNNKKFYLTLNIYPHESQLNKLSAHIKKMAKLNPDAFIVADPGVLEMVKSNNPEAEIHLSTQANALNSKSIKFWSKQGVKRVILARETTLKDLKLIKENIPKNIGLEYFVHGAMCVSYSGRCLLSSFFTGREANQGQCSQPCRWKYIIQETKDPKRELEIVEDQSGSYLLNSKTLCLIDQLEKLKPLNLASYKIEGRNKSIYYLATVTRAYRQAIDVIYSTKTKKEKEKVIEKAKSDLDKTNNRGFITGFMFGPDKTEQEYLTSRSQSNWQFAATVIDQEDSLIKLKANNQIKAGRKLELILPSKNKIISPKHFYLNKNLDEVKVVNTNDIFHLRSKEKISPNTIVRQTKPTD